MPRLPNLVRLYREGQNDALYTALRDRALVLVRSSTLYPAEWDDAVSTLVEVAYGVVGAASQEGLEGVVALRMKDTLTRLVQKEIARSQHEVSAPYTEPTVTVPGPEEQMVEAVTRQEQMANARELVKTLFQAEWLTDREKSVLHDFYTNGPEGAAERLGLTAENLRQVRKRIRDKMQERGLTE